MDRPERNPNAGYPLTDLYDDYAEAWAYIEHLEARLQVLDAELFRESARGDLLNKRNGRLEHEIGMVKPGSAAKAFMEEEYERMKSKVDELETRLVAGNLCEAELSLVSGSEVDTEMRQSPAGFFPLSMDIRGETRHFADSMAVLVNEVDGVATWRYYRKAGH